MIFNIILTITLHYTRRINSSLDHCYDFKIGILCFFLEFASKINNKIYWLKWIARLIKMYFQNIQIHTGRLKKKHLMPVRLGSQRIGPIDDVH